MYEEKLQIFLSNKQKKYPYISFNLSPKPFEQPSFEIQIFLEDYFSSKNIVNTSIELFPIDVFNKNYMISFSTKEIKAKVQQGKKEPIRVLIIDIHHIHSYNEKIFTELINSLEKLFKNIDITKKIKGSFLYIQKNKNA
jgi:hypothetical protein